MAILKLGFVDPGKMPANKAAYLAPYNRGIGSDLAKDRFRNELKRAVDAKSAATVWNQFTELKGNHGAGMSITELQKFLKEKGFMPHTNMDGVFGYRTLSGLRLFQEYVRTIEGYKEVTSDGIFGPTALKHIKRWQSDSSLTCEWNNKTPSEEYTDWLWMIRAGQMLAGAGDVPFYNLAQNFTGRDNSTLKKDKWQSGEDVVHLLGFRLNQGDGFTARDTNRDLFVLLINGMVFYFWGSTVPKPRTTTGGFPFLLEGQHEYHFGWHMLGSPHKTYQAFRSNGVLVLRTDKAKNTANINNQADLNKLLYDNNTKRGNPNPNSTINIHSSGVGTSNWSAGCQVISGADYINNRGKVVSCTDAKGMVPRPYGAYNVLEDLFISYCDPNKLNLYYTLMRVSEPFFDSEEVAKFSEKVNALVNKMK